MLSSATPGKSTLGLSPILESALEFAKSEAATENVEVPTVRKDSQVSWDADPWAEDKQASSIDEIPIVSDDVVMDDVDDMAESEQREGLDGVSPRMVDPPLHSVIVLDEYVEHGSRHFHVTTQDCAPRKPIILCRIYEDGTLVLEQGVDYSDLLTADGRVVDVSSVPVRVESTHERVVISLKEQGLKGVR